MFPQVDESENDACGKQACECDTQTSPPADIVVWSIARGAVHECAVHEHRRLESVKCEVAFRAIGECAIRVEFVTEQVEGCEVEMDAVDEHISGVGALGVLDEVPNVEERHHTGLEEGFWVPRKRQQRLHL